VRLLCPPLFAAGKGGCGSSVLDLPAACCGLSSPAAPSIISSCPTSCACAHCCFSAAAHPSAALPARDVWVKFGPAGLLGPHFGLLEARLRWFAPHCSCRLLLAAASIYYIVSYFHQFSSKSATGSSIVLYCCCLVAAGLHL